MELLLVVQVVRVRQSEEEKDCRTEEDRAQIFNFQFSYYLSNTLLNSLTLILTGSTMNSGRL